MNFIFGKIRDKRVAYTSQVQAGIGCKEELLDALSCALRFPSYFGANWDALDECMSDLSWLPSGDVILVHEDLPIPGDSVSLKTYLSILNDLVEKWRVSGKRNFVVVFPIEARKVVLGALEEGKP